MQVPGTENEMTSRMLLQILHRPDLTRDLMAAGVTTWKGVRCLRYTLLSHEYDTILPDIAGASRKRWDNILSNQNLQHDQPPSISLRGKMYTDRQGSTNPMATTPSPVCFNQCMSRNLVENVLKHGVWHRVRNLPQEHETPKLDRTTTGRLRFEKPGVFLRIGIYAVDDVVYPAGFVVGPCFWSFWRYEEGGMEFDRVLLGDFLVKEGDV
jgi:hypothetical protein